MTIGRMELTRPITNEEIGDPVMLDPTRVTDGIEISDDPILQARRIYETSVAHRTGGWKGEKRPWSARRPWSEKLPRGAQLPLRGEPSPAES